VYNPKFLTKNKITSVSQITTSHGNTDSNKLRLIDRNDEIVYTSVAGTTGSRTILWTPVSPTAINRIIVKNCNWKDFTISYNGGTSFNPDLNFNDNNEENLYFETNDVTVTSVLITVTDTFTASDVTRCGELYIGSEIFAMASGTAGNYKINADSSQKLFNLSDGTSYKVFIRKLLKFMISLRIVTLAERDNYLDLFNRNKRETFYFIPHPVQPSLSAGLTFPFTFTGTFGSDGNFGLWDGVGCHVNWVNGFDFENFDGDVFDNGYLGNVELAQAGGLG
jgi:hypothetical protein